MAYLEGSLLLGIQASLRLRRMVSLSLSLSLSFCLFSHVMHMHTCAKFICHNKTNKPIGNEKFADTVLKFLLYCKKSGVQTITTKMKNRALIMIKMRNTSLF